MTRRDDWRAGRTWASVRGAGMSYGAGYVWQLAAVRLRTRGAAVVSFLARLWLAAVALWRDSRGSSSRRRDRVSLRRGWEAFDPRNGRPVRRFWTETGAAIWTERTGRGMDYARRGDGWTVDYVPGWDTVRRASSPGVRVTVTGHGARRKLAGFAAVLMAFGGGWLAGAGSMSTAGADAGSCPAGTVATYSLDRGDMSRCVSPAMAAAESGAAPIPVRVTGDAVRGYTVTRVVDGAGVDTDTAAAPGACDDFRGRALAYCRGAVAAEARLVPDIRRALRYGIRPCVSDDGAGARPCVWRAGIRGNGRGQSFIMTRNGAVYPFGGAR